MRLESDSLLGIKIRISFIIPVYNAEEEVLDCIRSIVDQQLDDIEIVCIDDSSTDNSFALIDAQAKLDPRIKLLRQPTNLGAPAARNRAMQHAQGTYLFFIDADDRLAANSIQGLYQQAEESDCDAIKGLMIVAKAGGKNKPHPLNQSHASPATRLESCPDIQHLYQYTTYLFRAAVIRKSNLRFDTSLSNFQDPEFLSRLLPACQKIVVTMIPVYIRVVRQDSIVSSKWDFKNYDSLARGALLAQRNCLALRQTDTASSLASTFSRWWYKFEVMPASLSKEECFDIYSLISKFSEESSSPIFQFSWLKAGGFHALKLISQGNYDRCYEIMCASQRISRSYPRLVTKVFDLASLAHAIILRKV